jgi:hypothetical protein
VTGLAQVRAPLLLSAVCRCIVYSLGCKHTQQWLSACWPFNINGCEVCLCGSWRTCPNVCFAGIAGTLSMFGTQQRYDLRHSFPLLTTKRVFWKGKRLVSGLTSSWWRRQNLVQSANITSDL